RKRTFRLNHPEFRRMPCCVGILRPESGTESVNIAECLSISLAVQLAADRQICLFSEEILAEIHFAFFIQRRILWIQSRHPEHFSRAFTVASRNKRSVYIDKASLLEK